MRRGMDSATPLRSAQNDRSAVTLGHVTSPPRRTPVYFECEMRMERCKQIPSS
jgi:hypothetical protein